MLGKSQFQMVNVDDLVLDVDNPRIKKWIEYYEGTPSAANIKLALGVATGDEQSENGTTYSSLKESIRASGGINHPIMVNNDGEKMVVIEGNTRLAIYQDFKEAGVPGNWDEIPSIVYDNLKLEFIDAIRLQSHLVGPRAWDPYSKAKYLDTLYSVEHMTVERIIAYCGGKQRDIKNYIDGYRDMEKYYRPILDSDQDFDTTRFSGFIELQKPQVKESIVKAGKTLEDFAQWVDTKKIFPLSAVRQLPKILANEKSREIFYKSGAKEALKSLDSPNVDKVLSELDLAGLCRAIQRAIDNLQYSNFREMQANSDNPNRLAVLDLKDVFLQLVDDIEDE
jgi:hypothetical protein